MKRKEIFPPLIVSCQIKPGEPLYEQGILKKIIDCMSLAGISCIRTTASLTKYAHSKDLQVICVNKSSGAIRWINPTIRLLTSCVKHQSYAVAIEATHVLHRSTELLQKLFTKVHSESSSLVIADIATEADAIRADQLGADAVATTLARIKQRGGECDSHCHHCELIRKIRTKITIPIIAEGAVQTPQEALELLHAGADSVVIGHAIVNPLAIASYFNNIITTRKHD